MLAHSRRTHPATAATEPRRIGDLMRLAPNRITALRLVLLALLWLLAAGPWRVLVGPGLLLAAGTDVVDGMVARRTGTATRFGSAFDSVVDLLMNLSAVLFVMILRPSFVRENQTPLAVWGGFALGVLGFGWLRHRRLGNLHLYSAKAAGVVCYGFLATLFLFPDYSRLFFAVALGLAFVGTAETLAVEVSRRHVDEHAGSLLLGRRPRAAAGAARRGELRASPPGDGVDGRGRSEGGLDGVAAPPGRAPPAPR